MKIKITLFIFFISLNCMAQSYVTLYYNPDQFTYTTANHSTRIANEEMIKSKYRSVQEKYEQANEKVAQILLIRNQLHNYLTNVHNLLSNGKQLQRIYADLVQLYSHLGELSKLSAKYPEYAIFCTPTYQKVYSKSLECQQYITSVILKEDKYYLVDMHHRTLFLNKVQQEVRHLNLLVYSVVLFIQNGKNIPYWRHIPMLNLYYTMDKALIENILQQASWL
jgi:hypothetical protein